MSAMPAHIILNQPRWGDDALHDRCVAVQFPCLEAECSLVTA
jgi:hypothetical protein